MSGEKQRRTRMPDRVQMPVSMPGVLRAAITKAAEADYISDADYVRRAVVERLRIDGYLPQRPDGEEGES